MAGEDRVTIAERAAREGGAVADAAFRSELVVEHKEGKTDAVTRADRDAQRRVVEVVDEAYPGEPVVGEEADALKTVPESGAAWIVDPIDGTNNYVREHQVWATAVAAVVDGDPRAAAVVAPALGDAVVAGPPDDAGTTCDGDHVGTTRNGEPVRVSDRDDPEACHVGVTMWWPPDERDEWTAVWRAAVERFGDVRRVGSAQVTLSLVAAGGLDGAFTTRDPPPWDAVAGVHLIQQAGGRVTDVRGDPWTPDSRGLVVSNGAIHDELLAAAQSALDG